MAVVDMGKDKIRLPRTRINFPVVVFATAIGAALFFFGASASCEENKPESFIVSYGSISSGRAPLWIAQDLGLFARRGLDVKLVQIASGSISLSALLAGNVQLSETAGSAVVAAAAHGAPLVIIATDGLSEYKIVGHPSLRSVEDLKGKTIGVSRFGTGPDFLLRRALVKLGMIPGRDVAIIPTGLIGSDKRIDLIFQGRIDATLAHEGYIFQVQAEGHPVNVLADLTELGVHSTVSDISVTRRLLRERPDLIKAFLTALSEGIRLAKTDKELAFRMYRKYMRVQNPKFLELIHRTNLRRPAKPYPLEEAIQSDIEFLGATIPGLKDRKASEFVDTSILREMENEGVFSESRR